MAREAKVQVEWPNAACDSILWHAIGPSRASVPARHGVSCEDARPTKFHTSQTHAKRVELHGHQGPVGCTHSYQTKPISARFGLETGFERKSKANLAGVGTPGIADSSKHALGPGCGLAANKTRQTKPIPPVFGLKIRIKPKSKANLRVKPKCPGRAGVRVAKGWGRRYDGPDG